MGVSDSDIRKSLTNFGYDVGPITDTTRKVYQMKLKEFETVKTYPKRGEKNH